MIWVRFNLMAFHSSQQFLTFFMELFVFKQVKQYDWILNITDGCNLEHYVLMSVMYLFCSLYNNYQFLQPAFLD